MPNSLFYKECRSLSYWKAKVGTVSVDITQQLSYSSVCWKQCKEMEVEWVSWNQTECPQRIWYVKKFRSMFSTCVIYDNLPLYLLVKSSQSPSVDFNDFFVILLKYIQL